MVLYRCNFCSYESNHKGNYLKHLNRKKKCYNDINIKPEKVSTNISSIIAPKCTENSANINKNITDPKSIFKCDNCGKIFSRKSSLIRHNGSRCKLNSDNINNEILSNIVNKLSDMSNEHEKQRKEWDSERKEFCKIISDLSKDNAKTINQTFNQNNQIIINNHGEEDLKYITAEYLTELLKIPYKSIPKLVKQIHFNPEHPENHNLKITNKKLPYIQVYMDKQWHIKDKKEVIDNILDKSIGILDEHFDEQHELSQSQKERYITFTQSKADKDYSKKLIKDTELCVINNSDALIVENN